MLVMFDRKVNMYSEARAFSIPSSLCLGDVLSVQDVEERGVGRLLLVAVVPEKSGSFAAERSWDPAVSVLDTLHEQLASLFLT